MNMFKYVGMALSASMLVVGAGCSHHYHTDAGAPAINVTADHKTVMVGETVWVHATTMNLVGANGIRWSVSPTTAQIQPDGSRADQWARFSANQPGGYQVTASAQSGPNGQTVADRTDIQVVGQ